MSENLHEQFSLVVNISNRSNIENEQNDHNDNVIINIPQKTKRSVFEYPEYAMESARIKSFSNWPKNVKQTPEELSEAGFFYVKVRDRVRCYSCGGGLKDWSDDDNPWKQHALWYGNCMYVKLFKGINYAEEIDHKFSKSTWKHDEIKKTSPIEFNATQNPTNNDKQPTEDKNCKICFNNECNAVFLPCGHVVACAKCASSVTKCCVCQKTFQDIVRIYFS